jgi:two-component system, OmpR family, response regulator VicR
MERVLVVDDEEFIAEIITMLVEELSYQAITASNGMDALNKLHSYFPKPALVISDVMMPRMNGLELTRAIKNDNHYRAIPVILMSAAGCPNEPHLADYFLEKPFDLDPVAKLIEHIIGARAYSDYASA